MYKYKERNKANGATYQAHTVFKMRPNCMCHVCLKESTAPNTKPKKTGLIIVAEVSGNCMLHTRLSTFDQVSSLTSRLYKSFVYLRLM